MKELVEKLRSLEVQIAKQKGEFSLFALFLREEAPDKWDLVVSASWFWREQKKTLNYLAEKLRSHLTRDELLILSRIVLIDATDPGLEAIHGTVDVEHGATEVMNCNFFGLEIRHAYIITSKRKGRVAVGHST